VILFLKAAPSLFPDLVRVKGHARADGTYVRPYQARRLRAEAVDQPELAQVSAQDPYTGEWGDTCPFCGGKQRIEIGEMWTDHNFTIDTCCPGLHEETTREMAEDPEYAARLLRRMGAEDHAGGELRRVAYTDDGFGPVLLDWQPEVREVSRKEAQDFVARWHRHNPPLPLDIWRAGVWNGPTLLGVVVLGAPTARAYMEAFRAKDLAEVRRVAIRTDLPRELTWKAASTLYRAAEEEAARRGYRKLITYTLADQESGMSLRYARWKPEATVRGKTWNTPSRPRADKAPTGDKVRWFRRLGT
jgi:hypothetical protein